MIDPKAILLEVLAICYGISHAGKILYHEESPGWANLFKPGQSNFNENSIYGTVVDPKATLLGIPGRLFWDSPKWENFISGEIGRMGQPL